MNIVIITHNMDIGGVQKSVSSLANALDYSHKITLLLLEDHKEQEYTLSSSIIIDAVKTLSLEYLSRNKGNKSIGEFLFNYRVETLNSLLYKYKPELIISYEDYSNIILMSSNYRCKKILSCRISLQHIYTDNAYIHLLPAAFYFQNIIKLYPLADSIICVSRKIEKEIKTLNHEINTTTIYNGLDKQSIKQKSLTHVNINKPYILSVGRLHPQKAHTVLLKAFSLIYETVDHDLVIIGDGVEEKKLKEFASKLNIRNRIHFLGKILNPYHYMANASLFVFSSINEGFSNTILEAMYCGCGVISSKYPGYDEILNDYNNIYPVDDPYSMALCIKHFILKPKVLITLKKKQNLDISGFTLEKTISQYISVINNVMQS